MSKPTLAARVAKLEQQVTELVANGVQPKQDWQSTIGMFSGDEIMREVFAEAMKIREADRRKARKRSARKRWVPAR